MFPRAVAAAVGTGGEESHNQVSAGPCSVPQAYTVGRGERFLLVLLIKLQLAFFPITLCTHEFATVGLLLPKRLLHKCIYFNEKPNGME